MRLLVTGASGFVGRHVILRAPADWDLVAVYNQALDFPSFVARERPTSVQTVPCDLTKAADVQALRDAAGNVDAALYLAANGDPAASAREPLRDLHQNAVALLTFLEYCPVPHLVFVSSGAVYDGSSGLVTPSARLSPRLPYAISKLASEQYLDFYANRRGSPRSAVSVRFFGAYGPYEPLRKITTRFLAAVARGDREFIIRGDGRNLIDFMHVDDAVDGLLSIVARPGGSRRTVDFASGHPLSIDDIVHTMVRVSGSDISLRHEGKTEEYIAFQSGDDGMAEEYGFTPRITFADGFDRLRGFIAAHADAAVRG